MAPRVTISVTSGGALELWLNEEGRDLFVQKLRALNEENEHFHLGTFEGAEVQLGSRGYRPTDKVIDAAKVLFRMDEWDMQYYPHVLDAER